MNFLLDQDVYGVTARFLADLGHDVVPVSQIGLSRTHDDVLLKTAQQQGRLFVTRDRDFGALAFVKGLGGGILYLRMLPSDVDRVHEELARVLSTYSEAQLRQAFVVIEPMKHRFRRIEH